MTTKRHELLQMLQDAWDKEPEQDLLRVIEHLAAGAGHLGSLSNLKDDVLLYQLEKQGQCCSGRINGVHSEYVPDFHAALLSARGCKT